MTNVADIIKQRSESLKQQETDQSLWSDKDGYGTLYGNLIRGLPNALSLAQEKMMPFMQDMLALAKLANPDALKLPNGAFQIEGVVTRVHGIGSGHPTDDIPGIYKRDSAGYSLVWTNESGKVTDRVIIPFARDVSRDSVIVKQSVNEAGDISSETILLRNKVEFERTFHGNGSLKIQTSYDNGYYAGYWDKTTELRNEKGELDNVSGPARIHDYHTHSRTGRRHIEYTGRDETYAIDGKLLTKSEFEQHPEVIAYREEQARIKRENSWQNVAARRISGVFSRFAERIGINDKLDSSIDGAPPDSRFVQGFATERVVAEQPAASISSVVTKPTVIRPLSPTRKA